MMYSISIDEVGRVNGVCPDDLSGGVGWSRVTTSITPQTELFDAHGVALYKLVNNKVVNRTPAEIAADTLPVEVPTPTTEERLMALEGAMLDVLLGGN